MWSICMLGKLLSSVVVFVRKTIFQPVVGVVPGHLQVEERKLPDGNVLVVGLATAVAKEKTQHKVQQE